MDSNELTKELKKLNDSEDRCWEEDHITADELLLKFIDNEDVTEAFHDLGKWYS